MSPAEEHLDPDLLRRRLARERARRVAAEQIGERLTSELHATVERLEHAQTNILEQSDRTRVVGELARRLRSASDTESLLTLGAAETGTLLGVDRCQLHLDNPVFHAVGDWCVRDAFPPPRPLAGLPSPLTALLSPAAGVARVVVEDLTAERSLSEVAAALGVRALAGVRVEVAAHRLGWLLLLSIEPRRWKERELVLAEGIAQDLGASVLEVQAAEQRESVRRLEELDRAKDALVSNVSHELRTPLSSISGYLELLEEGHLGSLTPASANAVRVIARNTERLTALVDNLLQLSTQAANPGLELSDVDLGVVAAECRRSLLPIIRARSVDLSLSVAPTLRPIRGDRGQVEQVVLNLVGNALKFTPAGGEVSVTVDNAGAGVALVVADTGIGIPSDEMDGVCSRFFRSSLSVSREIQGTGLGLALTKSIVNLHGGRMTVESTEGVGTTVRIDLPAEPASQVTAPPPPTRRRISHQSPKNGRTSGTKP